ncbi:hypothetical protein Tco_1328917 [Tanacetum coccineum]
MLWLRRLSYLNFESSLAFKESVVLVLPKSEVCQGINYVSSCEVSKAKRGSSLSQRLFQPRSPNDKKASDYDNPDPAPELQNVSPLADTTVPSQQEYGYIKNHKKTVKNGQTRTRETEEYKRAKDSKPKSKKVNFSQLWVNRSQLTRRQLPNEGDSIMVGIPRTFTSLSNRIKLELVADIELIASALS